MLIINVSIKKRWYSQTFVITNVSRRKKTENYLHCITKFTEHNVPVVIIVIVNNYSTRQPIYHHRFELSSA